MKNLAQWIALDQEYTQALNGSDSLFIDGFMYTLTSTLTWIPISALLIFVIVRNNDLQKIAITLGIVVLTVVIADQFSSTICKPYFQRLRPAQDGELMYLMDVVNEYRGGGFSFISGHASNSFAMAVLLSMIIRNRLITITLFCWAILFSYSRIYLGLHYLGDILFGTLWGCTAGLLCYGLLYVCYKKNGIKASQISPQFTLSGYRIADVELLLLGIFGTFAYVIFKAILFI